MDKIDLQKLEELSNQHVIKVVEEAIQLCKPAKVVVITDSKEDIALSLIHISEPRDRQKSRMPSSA